MHIINIEPGTKIIKKQLRGVFVEEEIGASGKPVLLFYKVFDVYYDHPEAPGIGTLQVLKRELIDYSANYISVYPAVQLLFYAIRNILQVINIASPK